MGGENRDASIRTYVLRGGRITESQKEAIKNLGPAFMVPFSEQPFAPEEVFGDAKPVVVEIGFGMGQASWQIAQSRPMFNYLGIEVHSPGVGRLLMDLDAHAVTNMRILQHDAVEALKKMIVPETVAGFHIFYPDPWPKKRHHKRRLMRKDILDLIVSRMAPRAYLYFVTDIEEYAESTLALLEGNPLLENQFEGFAGKIAWRPETRFEKKAADANRGVFELYFTKRTL